MEPIWAQGQQGCRWHFVQLVRSGGYFTVGKVYDRSATYGNKPCPTVELQGEQLGKAIAVLSALSPVEVQFDDKQPTGFLFNCSTLFSIQQAVQAMKKSLRVCLRILFLPQPHSAMQRSAMKNTCTRWRWLCLLKFVVGSVLRRPPMPPRRNGLRVHIPAGEERRALEEVREMAKVFGDTVCKNDLQRSAQ